jgi:hypothetical protein
MGGEVPCMTLKIEHRSSFLIFDPTARKDKSHQQLPQPGLERRDGLLHRGTCRHHQICKLLCSLEQPISFLNKRT